MIKNTIQKIISGIYKIVNKVNGKYYVGSSKDIKNRWSSHKKELNGNYHHSYHLQRAWNMYGSDNFEFIVIEEIIPEKILEVEQGYLDIAKNEKEKVYNAVFKAGGGNFGEETNKKISQIMRGKPSRMKGKHHTEETKKLMSEVRTGTHPSEETKKLMSKIKTGTRHTEETKKLMSSMRGGKNSPMYGRKGINNPLYGKHRSEETKQKISLKLKGKLKSEEHKRKMSLYRRGET